MAKIILIPIIILFSAPSVACIWQSENKSGISPFWPSNNIEVCFSRPQPQDMGAVANPLDYDYRRHYQNSINIMKQTIQDQINARTGFNLTGFSYCEAGDTGSKIRINLNDTEGSGAMASSIGPRSAQDPINITISSFDQDWPGGVKPANLASGGDVPRRVRTFNKPEHMSWVGLHEIMHLLGFHHTEEWYNDMSTSDVDISKVIQFGSSPDETSVMSRGAQVLNSNGRAILSERDVACLNLVANKQILNYPARAANRPQPRPVTDQPAAENYVPSRK